MAKPHVMMTYGPDHNMWLVKYQGKTYGPFEYREAEEMADHLENKYRYERCWFNPGVFWFLAAALVVAGFLLRTVFHAIRQ